MTWTARTASKAGWWLAALLSVSVALCSYRYLAEIGPRAPEILANAFARPWLMIHVAGAATALLVGAFQFIPQLRKRVAPHRWRGRIYVIACLTGGVAGVILAPGSTAGPIAALGFGSLGILWVVVNLQGWRTAIARDFVAHRRWMIRSWALTLAAVTLRLYLPLIDPLGIAYIDGYRAISFLSWIPNLIVAEIYLRRI